MSTSDVGRVRELPLALSSWSSKRRSVLLGVLVLFLFEASLASAELPDAVTLMTELGLSKSEIASVHSGEMVSHAVEPASPRELVVGLAFKVPAPPSELMESLRTHGLDQVDSSVSQSGLISGDGVLADFEKLTFSKDPKARAKDYLQAKPGEDLNLSTNEIEAFRKLGAGAAPPAVEAQLRKMLLSRFQAYRSKGLDGIAPYARSGKDSLSAADELRTASKAAKALEKFVPEAYRLLSSYPQTKPKGTEESFGWSQFEAHGVPTIALTHYLFVPEGEAFIVVQRQFYVSASYNAEHALAAFLPTSGGTVVVYVNRTSTDQVTGFGGGAKRSIGSKLLASQIASLFETASKSLE